MIAFDSKRFKPVELDGETWTPSEQAALVHLEINQCFPVMGGIEKRRKFLEKLERLKLINPGKINLTAEGQTLAAVLHTKYHSA